MAWTTSNHSLVCDRTGTAHHLQIGLPVRHQALDSMPLIVCFDAPWVFGTVLDATRIMSMSGEAPEAIVVGVGFAEDSMGEYLRQRARWFTPTPFLPPVESGVKGVAADECGRADELRAFVSDQLLPFIEAEHSIGERWYVGHSFSALFGLGILLNQPDMFDKWLLASPSIWWDDRAILDVEQRRAAEHGDLAADVFMTAGSLERVSGFSIVDDVTGLTQTLTDRSLPGLRVHAAILEGDGHSNCIGNAVSKGMRALSRPRA